MGEHKITIIDTNGTKINGGLPFRQIIEFNDPERSFSISLLCNSIAHAGFLLLHVFVSLWGLKLWLSITEEHLKHVDIYNVKYYAAAYFTNWNYTFQTLFLALALTHDVLEWTSQSSSSLAAKVKCWRDVVFCSMVVPYTVFVTLMFWSLYWIDRELVFPKVLDEVAPWWFNHCIHTNIFIVLVVETLLQARRYPTNKKLELSLFAAVAIAYAVVYYSIFFLSGHWLYKVFEVLNWWQVCVYQILIWVFNLGVYFLQFPINRAIHGADEVDSEIYDHKQNGSVTEIVETADKDASKQNGAVKENGGVKENCTNNGDIKDDDSFRQNGVTVSSFKDEDPLSPFATKSWSLKYRSLRNQFEKTKL